MDHIVEIKDLVRTYRVGKREIPALQGVDMAIDRGQLVALRGRSGSGKTTLLNCVSGLDTPTSGEVFIHGESVTGYTERQRVDLRRKKLGFIFQSHALLPTYSARENIDLMLRLAGWPLRERQARAEEVLTQVGLRSWIDHRPFEMSGGQQQRVSIARAIAPRPSIVFADEPTGELDVATSEQILHLFKTLTREEEMTFLVVTHDPLVDEFADVIYHLQDGRVISRNTAVEEEKTDEKQAAVAA